MYSGYKGNLKLTLMWELKEPKQTVNANFIPFTHQRHRVTTIQATVTVAYKNVDLIMPLNYFGRCWVNQKAQKKGKTKNILFVIIFPVIFQEPLIFL